MNNIVEKIEKQLAEANNLLLELKKENETLKEENISLRGKIILLEKMIQDLKAPKATSRKVAKNPNEKTLKQDIDFLNGIISKNNYKKCFETIYSKNGKMLSTDSYTDSIISIKNNFELEGNFKPVNILNESNVFETIEEERKLDYFKEILKEENYLEYITLNSKELYRALNDTINYSSTQSDNIALSVICFEKQEKELLLSATDSYRLTSTHIDILEENNVNREFKKSIPTIILKPLLKDLKGLETEIKIYFKENSREILIKYLNRSIFSNCIDLAFPDYKNLLKNSSFLYSAKIKKNIFLECIEKAFKITKNNEIKAASDYIFEKDLLTIKSILQGQEIEQKIKIDYSGEKITLRLNDKFLIETIKNYTEEYFNFEFTSSHSVIRINTKNKNLLMPLAIREE